MDDLSSVFESFPTVVVDNGSGDIKAGFAGDDGPLVVLSNLIGHSPDSGETFVGSNAQEKREVVSLRRPVEHGIIVDWEGIETIWNFTFREMHIVPDQHPMLFTEPPFTPSGNKEKLTQIMFESVRVPFFYLAFEPILSLCSAGRLWGTMVDVGEGVTSVVPISEGTVSKHSFQRVDTAGIDVTLRLQDLLQKNGHSFSTSSELDVVREIKENCCFIKEESVSSSSRTDEKYVKCGDKMKQYKLPDGKTIDLGSECYLSPEILFEKNSVNLGQLVCNSIQSCDIENRTDLMKNIILCGGSTFLPGFKQRLHKDLISSMLPFSPKAPENIQIRADPQRKYHVWIGGSILGSFSSFNYSHMWVTKPEYDEYGPSIIHRKSLSS